MLSKLFISALPAFLLSLFINVGIFYLGNTTGWLNPNYILPNSTSGVTIVSVILATILPMVLGVLLFLVFTKVIKNPSKLFWVISMIFLIVSFIPIFSLKDADLNYKVILLMMHLTPGISMPYFLGKSDFGND